MSVETTDLAAWLTQIWDERELIVGNEVDVVAEFFPASEGYKHAYRWSRHSWTDDGKQGNSTAPGSPTPHEVLARIAADRQILADYERLLFDDPLRRTDYFRGQRDALEYAVKHLALPYADRPGYREEWKP